MKILALEFSSSHRSVAVMSAEGALLGAASEIGGRSLIALVSQALAQAGAEREEIGSLAIGLGPGSYTGIRGAVALAQGWQIGRDIKIVGVSSVDCVAAQAQEQRMFGEINIVIDAQRNEFYLARYEIGSDTLRLAEPLRLAALAEIEALKAGRLVGPDATSWFAGAANLYPEAATLGRLAAGRNDFVTGDKLEPIYLRAVSFRKAPAPRIIPDHSSPP